MIVFGMKPQTPTLVLGHLVKTRKNFTEDTDLPIAVYHNIFFAASSKFLLQEVCTFAKFNTIADGYCSALSVDLRGAAVKLSWAVELQGDGRMSF